MPEFFGRPGASPALAALVAVGFIRPEDRVLDVGCGDGADAVALARWGYGRVVGVDRDAVALRLARERARRWGVAGRVEWREADATRLDEAFAAGSFDVAIDALVWNNVKRDGDAEAERYARALHRVLAPGGRLVVQARAAAGQQEAEAPRAAFDAALARRFDLSPAYPTHLPERKARGRRSFAPVALAVGRRRDGA